MLAVTITFEKWGRSFERLLLAPIRLDLLMLAKTSGAIIFGIFNALVPLALASLMTDLSGIQWLPALGGIFLLAVISTFLGLLVAISVSQVFEAQTLSNFFRFPMIFLCGLFIPVQELPVFIQPVSYCLPVTYGVDILRAAIVGRGQITSLISFMVLAGFSMAMFGLSAVIVRRKWIY
jgi:ABC-2 type transport system permease protein